jgi:hypothetical protein
MRVSAMTWPFCFGVRLGWATTTIPNPDPGLARGRVYLLRGNTTVLSRGFGVMCDRFRRAGLWAEDLRCVGDRWLRQHLIADDRKGNVRGPVILIGHSCGGRYALFSARELARHGIAIELLVCIDVAMPSEVAGNVKQAVNLYRTQRRIYPARPIRPAPGSAARVTNLDLDSPSAPFKPTGLHHLNITASPAVQDWVVARVLDQVGETVRDPAQTVPAPG